MTIWVYSIHASMLDLQDVPDNRWTYPQFSEKIHISSKIIIKLNRCLKFRTGTSASSERARGGASEQLRKTHGQSSARCGILGMRTRYLRAMYPRR